ncbi:MAG: hypothetical protein M3R50_00660 [Bacteroidota bacterium]|nr:hypothetical protein [Bacteroidota bacterium]
MNITDIQLFQILKEKVGEKEPEALVSFVDFKVKENNETNLKILVTKEDITNVKEDIARLDVKISDVKSDIIRWVFAFFVALMLAIVGLYFKK